MHKDNPRREKFKPEVVELDRERESRIIELASPSQPMAVARVFIKTKASHRKLLMLHYWRGGWWSWRTTHWTEVGAGEIHAALYAFTEDAVYVDDKDRSKSWSPSRGKITDLAHALAGICRLPDDIDQPGWLDDHDHSDAAIVAVKNGLLDVANGRLLQHTPQFFNQTSVPFAYDPEAPAPTCWINFLGELWPDDPDAIDVLGEWFGYVVSGRTDMHKILLMVGPTRGGKGVIARILGSLIGRKNVAGPTLNSLAGEFGLAPLIGKPLAVISDARFAGKDSSIMVERLLSISGEDTLNVNRKHRDQWTGKLPSRLHVLSNELPKLGDASTAIVGRVVLLMLSNSWLGKEDHDLEPKLNKELSGILNWALAGLHRLTANDNRFTHLSSADEAVNAMRDLASPVHAFVREQCDVRPDLEIKVDDLYAAYKKWAEENGHSKKSKVTFGRDLRAAVPQIRKARPRADGRAPKYAGIDIAIATEGENDD